MPSKVRVYGKAQNRTALGIVHAYVVMYPHTTLEDLRKAFPNSICPDRGVPENFLPVEEAEKYNEKMSLYFAKPDEVIELQDGSKIALSQVWSKSSFELIVQQGKLYDVEVAEFEKTMKGEKGGYRLEYLNGYVPPVPAAPKKKLPIWLWILLGLIVAGVFHTSPKTKTGALESRAGWKGLIRKGETLLIVLVACRLDAVMGSSFVRDAVVIGFIANETLSIIENAGLMGVPIPKVLARAVDILKQRSEEEQKGS